MSHKGSLKDGEILQFSFFFFTTITASTKQVMDLRAEEWLYIAKRKAKTRQLYC